MPTHRASRIRILKETSSVRAKPIPEEISKRKTALQERHAHSPINRRRHALIALLIAGAILAAGLAACGQPANPEKSPAASASTREAKPLQAPEDQPPEQTISLPTTRAATTTTATVPTPVLLRETTNGETPKTPPPSTEQPMMTPEVTPENNSGAPFVQVSAGPFHTCGLRTDGTIICWGAHGEDERLTESAGLLDSPPGSFSQIDAAHNHSCAIRQDGAVKCRGGISIGSDIPPEEKTMMEAMWAPP